MLRLTKCLSSKSPARRACEFVNGDHFRFLAFTFQRRFSISLKPYSQATSVLEPFSMRGIFLTLLNDYFAHFVGGVASVDVIDRIGFESVREADYPILEEMRRALEMKEEEERDEEKR